MKLTTNQEKAMAFILSEIDSGKEFPRMGDIASHIGVKHASAARRICVQLEVRGYLISYGRGMAGLRWEVSDGVEKREVAYKPKTRVS